MVSTRCWRGATTAANCWRSSPVKNAGSNTAADHIAIIDAAIAAIPANYRRNLLITIDGAGSSHAVVEHLEKLNARAGWSVSYTVGFDLDERARVAIARMPADGWQPALMLMATRVRTPKSPS